MGKVAVVDERKVSLSRDEGVSVVEVGSPFVVAVSVGPRISNLQNYFTRGVNSTIRLESGLQMTLPTCLKRYHISCGGHPQSLQVRAFNTSGPDMPCKTSKLAGLGL